VGAVRQQKGARGKGVIGYAGAKKNQVIDQKKGEPVISEFSYGEAIEISQAGGRTNLSRKKGKKIAGPKVGKEKPWGGLNAGGEFLGKKGDTPGGGGGKRLQTQIGGSKKK